MATEEALQLELSSALESTGLCKVHRISSRKGDVRALFTILNERSGASRLPEWLRFISRFLAKQDPSYYLFVGERVFIESGALVKAWVMVVDAESGENMANVVRRLRQQIVNAQEEQRSNNALPAAISVPLGNETGMNPRVKPMTPDRDS